MPADQKSDSPIGSLLRKLLACLSQDWTTLLPDLYRTLRLWFKRQQHEGMYEIIEYDSILELVDPKGKKAIFRKLQRVKFLQDNIIAFQDFAWGDGNIFEDYQCSPGFVVDKYRDGDRWNILISLRQTKSAGDVTDFHIQRIAKNGFSKKEEWWQIEVRHPTRCLRLRIIFPKARRCQRAMLLQRSRHRSALLGPEHLSDLPDGRQILRYEIKNIRQLELFTLKWLW